MKRSISYLFFISCLMFLTPLYAATQTLTTYYPAPQGNYKNMQVNNILVLPLSGVAVATTCTQGTNNVYLVNNGSGALEVCDKNGLYTLTNSSLWANSGNDLYPYNAGASQHVNVGSATDLGYNLGVTGTFDVTGAATFGSTLGVTGAATFGSTLGVTGLATLASASVTGNTTLGTNASNTATINSTTTFSNGVTVNGAGTLNGTTTVGTSGSLTVKNGTSITLCTSGTSNCGTLEVAQGSDDNFYAVYGP